MSVSHTTQDGIEIEKQVPLKEWLTYGREWSHHEHIHVVPDQSDAELRLYRSRGEAGDDEKPIMTTVKNVRMSAMGTDMGLPDAWNLHAQKATTLVSFLTNLKWERTEARITVDYWKENNSNVLDESMLDMESLFIGYETDSGNVQEIEISDVYASQTAMMASY